MTHRLIFYKKIIQVEQLYDNCEKERFVEDCKRRGYSYHKVSNNLGYISYNNDIIVMFINKYCYDNFIRYFRQILPFINYSLNTCHTLSTLHKIFHSICAFHNYHKQPSYYNLEGIQITYREAKKKF